MGEFRLIRTCGVPTGSQPRGLRVGNPRAAHSYHKTTAVQTMADFTEYAGPSADWVALEPSLPSVPDVSAEELKQIVNKTREDLAAQGMKGQCLHSNADNLLTQFY